MSAKRTFTVFCQEAEAGGTIWIDTVEADNVDLAHIIAQAKCAEDWSMNEADVHVLGIAEGNVTILYWQDQDQ